MDTIFAAVDISSLATNCTTILVGFVGVGLLFTGYKYARRALQG